MGIEIGYLNIEERIRFRTDIIKEIAAIVLEEERLLGEINFIFTNNTTILSINQEYLDHQYYTDVITFNRCKKKLLSGDIYISIEQVRLNAKKYKSFFDEEVLRVMIHGVLHLIGYNDQSDNEKNLMREKEDIYLCRFK